MSAQAYEVGIEVDKHGNLPWIHREGPCSFEAFHTSSSEPDFELIPNLTFTYLDEDGKPRRRADAYNLAPGIYAYSQRVELAFKSHLQRAGVEFFAINCEGDKLFLLKGVPVVAAIDLQRSQVQWYDAETVRQVTDHVFVEEVVSANILFKDAATKWTHLYCNEVFVEIYRKAGLTGLTFAELPARPRKTPARKERKQHIKPTGNWARKLTVDETSEIARYLEKYALLQRRHLPPSFSGSRIEGLSSLLDVLRATKLKRKEREDVVLALAAAWLDVLRTRFSWTAGMIRPPRGHEALAALSPNRSHALLVGEYFLERMGNGEGENTVQLITNMIEAGKLPASSPGRLIAFG